MATAHIARALCRELQPLLRGVRYSPMPRQLTFPDNPEHFIILPERWKGLSLMRYQEAGETLSGEKFTKLPAIFAQFFRHLSILEDWKLDGVNGNVGAMNFDEVDLREVLWVNEVVSTDFGQCFIVPKAWRLPLQNGPAEAETTATALSPGN